MATVERVNSKRSKKYPLEERRKTKSHVLRNSFLVLLCLLVVGTYAAPWIIATTPLRNWLLQTALAPDGTITLGSASLGWFSPVAADQLEIRDSAGDSVVSVKSMRSEKSLIAMLLDVDDLGRLHIAGADVHLVAHEKDTNLERVFASLLSAEGDSHVTAQFDVSEATIAIDDAVAKRQFKVTDLKVDCALGDATEGLVLAASGTLQSEQQPADFKVDLRATPSSETGAALANGKIACQTHALPLELLDPLVRRSIDNARFSGHLSAQLDGAWGDLARESKASLTGEVHLTQLAFAAKALGSDEIRLDHIDMPCRIRQNGDAIQIDELAVDCELGHVELSGSAKTSDFSAGDVASALAHENYQLKGHLDLANLAKMLPDTLKIREGTEITGGQIDLAATARQQPSGMSWTGLVESSRLAATANGRPFAWEKPLEVQFALHETDHGIVIDRAICTSSFLKVNAAGAFDDMTASADFDLARLIMELRQFSDLNDFELAGQGRARLELKRIGADEFAAQADFQARGFQWIRTGRRPWTEDNLLAKLAVNGTLDGQSIKRIETATLTVESGSDHLDARLREAIADPTDAKWPIACAWRGQLVSWTPRLESCLGLSGWDFNGAGTLNAKLVASPKAIQLESAQFDVAELRAAGGGWFVNEPAVSSTLSGTWDRDRNRVELTNAKVSAGTAVAVVERATLQSTDAGWSIDGGNAHFEAELAQLLGWHQDPRQPPAWEAYGKLAGDAQLKHISGTTSGQVQAAVDRLQIVDLARPANPKAPPAVWREERLTLAAQGNYEHAVERLKLESLEVKSDALRVDAAGAVSASDLGGDMDLKGTLAYDWAQLAPLWRPYLGPSFQIAGRQTKEFSIRGKLTGSPASPESWKNVTGQAAIGWTDMNLYGLRVGQADIVAQLANGQASTQPIDLEISEGRLTVAPVARLSPEPAELFLPSGPLMTNVRLSPELCAEGLRFVTPLLANATVAEGRFSISLDGGHVPLRDPQAADVSGHMAMKGQIKPGPIASEFVGLIKELVTIVQRGSLPNLNQLDGSLMSVDNSNIEFRMMNRRVYHRGLTLVIGTTPVTTEGWVGLDESLSMVAEVPINARLLGADLSLGTLEGKKLRIPISGTLKNPKLDRRALADIPAQLIENAARGVLIDGLNKGLERFLPTQP